MKKTGLCLVLITVLLSVCLSCKRSSREEQCEEMVKREKRRLPRNVAAGVTLDSILYDKRSQTLLYYYTMSDSIYSDEMVAQGKSRLQDELQREIINSVSLKRLKDEGISFKYIYLGSETKRKRMEMFFESTSRSTSSSITSPTPRASTPALCSRMTKSSASIPTTGTKC